MLCSIGDELEGNLDFVSDVLAANLVLAKAERATFLRGGRALAPADGAFARRVVLTWRVAQGSALLHTSRTDERCTICTTVRVLSTADANVCHALRAIRSADAATDIMEVFVALGVPELAPLFTMAALVNLASATPVGVRLVAIGTVIAESCVVGAVLPADGTNT